MNFLRRDRSAVISIELALLAGLVLMPLTLGAVDAGELVVARARLDQALHAALFYAYSYHGAVTAADVEAAARAGYGSGTAPTVSATLTQYCIAPSNGYPQGGPPRTPTNGSCSSTTLVKETYLSVSASASVSLPFSVQWVARTVTLNVSGKARIS